MHHFSTAVMVEKLVGMLGTDDLSAFETGFVISMQGHLQRGTLTSITERQIEVLENIHSKHFA